MEERKPSYYGFALFVLTNINFRKVISTFFYSGAENNEQTAINQQSTAVGQLYGKYPPHRKSVNPFGSLEATAWTQSLIV